MAGSSTTTQVITVPLAAGLCESHPIPWRYQGAADGAEIVDRIRDAAFRQGVQSGDGVPSAIPFADVLVKGREEPGRILRHKLKSLFDLEFADTGQEMAVTGVTDPRLDPMRYYFGFGVFAPQSSDRLIADLHFSFSRPDAYGRVPAEEILVPRLSEEPGAREASWYAGQNGLAIGFRPETAPCVLPWDRVPRELADLILFIGRRSPTSPPRIELYAVNSEQTDVTAIPPDPEWSSGDGQWRELGLLVGTTRLTLWMRLAARTGAARFFAAAPPPKRAAVVVLGLILPRVQLFSWFGSGAVRRWMVRFDTLGRLRVSEIWDTKISVVSDRRFHLAAYHHDDDRWTSWHNPRNTAADLQVSGNRFVRPDPFPLNLSRDDPRRERERTWRSIYGSGFGSDRYVLLRPTGDRAFGYMDVAGGRVTAEPEVSHDVEPTDKIGLGWVDRAAMLETSGKYMGLAEYWLQNWEIAVEDAGDRLVVRMKDRRFERAPAKTYNILPGQPAPIGPLLVDFRPGDEG